MGRRITEREDHLIARHAAFDLGIVDRTACGEQQSAPHDEPHGPLDPRHRHPPSAQPRNAGNTSLPNRRKLSALTWRPKLMMNVVMPMATFFSRRSMISFGMPVGHRPGAPVRNPTS